jgi:hypothetical protein
MPLVLADRVKETTTTTGTGTITLLGAATGFQAFSVIGNGNTTYYCIAGQGTSEWEVGVGTYTASGTTLSRDTVLASSAGAPTKTNFSGGTKDVFVTYPAERSVYSDGTNIVPDTSAILPPVSGGTGQSSLTANNVILGNGTSAVQFVAPGTNGNVLTSNGTTWTSAAGGGFDAGTRMIFAQNTAPTGWTKDTTNYNNHALRIVTGTGGGTGGSVDFTTAFASQTPTGTVTVSGSVGDTTLAAPTIPSHQHRITAPNFNAGGANSTPGAAPAAFQMVYGVPGTRATSTSNTGGGGAHSHPISAPATFSGSAINLAVKYLDVITATKN